jgi:hypothetical protein
MMVSDGELFGSTEPMYNRISDPVTAFMRGLRFYLDLLPTPDGQSQTLAEHVIEEAYYH